MSCAAWCFTRTLGLAEQPPDLPPELRHGYEGAFFTDMNHGYVFGDDAIVATDDAGATWRLVRKGGGVESIFFLNRQTFWVLYEGGQLHATTDGGRTFAVGKATFLDPALGEREGLCGQLFFSTATDGWSICGRSLLKTSSAGQTWKPSLLLPELGESHRIYMFDTREGVAVERFHPVMRTTDAGLTWAPIPGSPKLDQLSCTAAGFCAGLGGPQGPVLASTDRGRSWRDTHIPLQPPDRDEIRDVQALGLSVIVVGGGDIGFSPARDLVPYIGTGTPIPEGLPERAIVMRWDGSTWTRFTQDQPREVQGLYFVDAQHGWLVGTDENLIYKTTDGGQTLQFVSDYFRQIAALTPTEPPPPEPTPTPGLIITHIALRRRVSAPRFRAQSPWRVAIRSR
jgi:photosystem II stability/assembly factor-like uncharacterized protein